VFGIIVQQQSVGVIYAMLPGSSLPVTPAVVGRGDEDMSEKALAQY